MPIGRKPWIALFAMLLSCAVWAENEGGEPAEKPKYSPGDVEVRLRDGTVLRGQLKNIDSIPLKTNYGTLAIPIADIVNFSRARRPALPTAKDITVAVKNLGASDMNDRASAQETLELAGNDAVDPLFESRSKAPAETRERIDALIKRILGREKRKVELDSVIAAKFKGRGIIDLPAITVQSKLGLLQLKTEEVLSVRCLTGGTVRKIALELPGAMREWLDTSIEAITGEPIAVSCFGQINVFGNQIVPAGAPNWSSRPFRAGTVIAKLGANGEPFAIGNRKRWLADSSDRLYLRVFFQEDVLTREESEPASGQYDAKIGSGTWADDPSLQNTD